MKKVLILFLLLFAVSCANIFQKEPKTKEEMLSILEEELNKSRNLCKDTSFGDEKEIAICDCAYDDIVKELRKEFKKEKPERTFESMLKSAEQKCGKFYELN